MSGLTHLDAAGAMRMVDVGGKLATRRRAVAQCEVRLSAAARRALRDGSAKGDTLAAARLAGIQAAKRTWELIPLCHPLPLSHLAVELQPMRGGLRVRAIAETTGPTGVEMEALTAASVAALTLYDMLKAIDKGMRIENLHLVEKVGGKSGIYRASSPRGTSKTR